MKKRQHIKKNLVTALEIPMDLAYQDAILTLTGRNQAVIENYRSILYYTREKIVVSTLRGKITICGKRLEIPCYGPEEMLVSGCISGVFLER